MPTGPAPTTMTRFVSVMARLIDGWPPGGNGPGPRHAACLARMYRAMIHAAMIVSTRGGLAADAVRDRYGKGFPTHLVKRTRAMLSAMNAAAVLGDLRFPPGNRLEELRGDRAGQHSIRMNDQWRICFVWTDLGPADVEIVDYH